MKEYLKPFETVLNDVGSSREGLSSAEAEKRLAANGKNKLAEAKKPSVIRKFFGELADPMIIILLVAAAVSAVTAAIENESFTDVFIILAVNGSSHKLQIFIFFFFRLSPKQQRHIIECFLMLRRI